MTLPMCLTWIGAMNLAIIFSPLVWCFDPKSLSSVYHRVKVIGLLPFNRTTLHYNSRNLAFSLPSWIRWRCLHRGRGTRQWRPRRPRRTGRWRTRWPLRRRRGPARWGRTPAAVTWAPARRSRAAARRPSPKTAGEQQAPESESDQGSRLTLSPARLRGGASSAGLGSCARACPGGAVAWPCESVLSRTQMRLLGAWDSGVGKTAESGRVQLDALRFVRKTGKSMDVRNATANCSWFFCSRFF